MKRLTKNVTGQLYRFRRYPLALGRETGEISASVPPESCEVHCLLL